LTRLVQFLEGEESKTPHRLIYCFTQIRVFWRGGNVCN